MTMDSIPVVTKEFLTHTLGACQGGVDEFWARLPKGSRTVSARQAKIAGAPYGWVKCAVFELALKNDDINERVFQFKLDCAVRVFPIIEQTEPRYAHDFYNYLADMRGGGAGNNSELIYNIARKLDRAYSGYGAAPCAAQAALAISYVRPRGFLDPAWFAAEAMGNYAGVTGYAKAHHDECERQYERLVLWLESNPEPLPLVRSA